MGVSSELEGDHLVIEFPDEVARTHFRDWLTESFAKAAQGYKTMWP